ncbi:MAG: hypothetical protein HUJ73_04170, partial [Eubacterium sp.]|nr:hypothetical protein [Eubacterium sp.]
GKPELVDLSFFRNKSVDYLALGHIHSFQEDSLPPRGLWCCPGCLEGRGFDECGVHGFVLMEVNGKTQDVRREFVPFAQRRLWEIPVDVSGCMTTGEAADRIEEVLSGLQGNENSSPASGAGDVKGSVSGSGRISSGDLWKIILTGETDVDSEISTGLLQKRFEDRCYFLKVKDQTTLHVDYRDYALDASLKGEFVRLVSRDPSLEEQEKAEIIRCGIRALSGESWQD